MKMLVGKTRYLSYFTNLSRDLPPPVQRTHNATRNLGYMGMQQKLNCLEIFCRAVHSVYYYNYCVMKYKKNLYKIIQIYTYLYYTKFANFANYIFRILQHLANQNFAILLILVCSFWEYTFFAKIKISVGL